MTDMVASIQMVLDTKNIQNHFHSLPHNRQGTYHIIEKYPDKMDYFLEKKFKTANTTPKNFLIIQCILPLQNKYLLI